MALSSEESAAVAAEWHRGPDGMWEREAARVAILDSDGRILLIRGHDIDDSTWAWWFTVGGGMAQGETPQQAACRELAEETGLSLGPERLEGPVLERTALFHFVAETRRQHELFFLVRLAPPEVAGVGEGAQWTPLEREVLDGMRWFTASEIEHLSGNDAVFPQHLADYVRAWNAGWDGSCPHIHEG